MNSGLYLDFFSAKTILENKNSSPGGHATTADQHAGAEPPRMASSPALSRSAANRFCTVAQAMLGSQPRAARCAWLRAGAARCAYGHAIVVVAVAMSALWPLWLRQRHHRHRRSHTVATAIAATPSTPYLACKPGPRVVAFGQAIAAVCYSPTVRLFVRFVSLKSHG